MGVKNQIKPRPKPAVINTISESAPWVLVSKASSESGLTENLIRNTGITLRPFGNADYIRPTALNAWILADGKEGPQP